VQEAARVRDLAGLLQIRESRNERNLTVSRTQSLVLSGALALAFAVLHQAYAQRYLQGTTWPEPPVVTPGDSATHSAPSDAKVLFDGKNLEAWKGIKKTTIDADGGFTVRERLETNESFGDCQLHVEFATPTQTKDKKGRELKGQARGNNGIGLMDARYEIQVMDSYENKTYPEGQCGAVYNQTPPMVNASRKPGEWQTYDIIFNAPRFAEDGKLARPGYVTVLHNGVAVQNHTQIKGSTFYDRENLYTKHPDKQPLVLMYHGDPVRFRNIWIRAIKELEGKASEKKKEG
jgi:hypothetical protein